LHARRKTFPAFSDIATAVAEVWPWGEMAEVAEVASRLSHQFLSDLVEASHAKSRPKFMASVGRLREKRNGTLSAGNDDWFVV
jgi:hypothetical protein